MGFFSLKVTCAICEKDVGLNRYQLSKDTWICPDCLKRAGGMSQFHIIKKMSIEDIKKAVNIYNEKLKEHSDLLSEFEATKKVGNYISIDETKRQFCIKKNIYNFSDILNFELIEDGETLSKGGLGSAAIGGALFGGVGAVVGSMTGTKKTKSICSKLQIKITLRNIENPVIYINLIFADTRKDGILYKSVYSDAQEILSLLQLMTEENKSANIQSKETSSIADELKKYNDLLECGAITKDEYDKIKSNLLGI